MDISTRMMVATPILCNFNDGKCVRSSIMACEQRKKYDTRRLNHIGGSPGEPGSAWVRVLNQR